MRRLSGAVLPRLTVATAQLKERDCLQKTVARIKDFIGEASDKGAQLIAFPEAAITGYGPDAVARATSASIASAEDELRAACRHHSIAAVIGTPRSGYNSALVIGSNGAELGRQHKQQLVPTDLPWSTPGDTLHVFEDAASKFPFSVIICHDKRYPELVRLPVLAGSRLVVYISAESYHDDLPLPAPRPQTKEEGGGFAQWDEARLSREMGVYTAQAQARAVENRVHLIKSNWAGDAESPLRGSHGGSCIVDPTGIVTSTLGIYEEGLLCSTLELDDATALYANKSLLPEYALSGWWRDALQRVKRVSNL